MTYVLGARCTDGIALVSDRKGSGGINPTYDEDKLTEILPGIVYGGAGFVYMIDRFSDEITDRVKNGKIKNWSQLLNFMEKKSRKFTEKYIFDYEEEFDIIISVQGSPSKLYSLNTEEGFASPVKKHIAIGSGYVHGNSLLEELWVNGMTMMEFAKIGYFLIEYVTEMKLDDNVGGKPTAWFIPDIIYEEIELKGKDERKAEIEEKFPIRNANNEEIKEMKEYSRDKLLIMKKCIHNMKHGSRKFHPEVVKHYGEQFLKENYFGAVNECCKAFDKYVAEKAKIKNAGRSLMQEAFNKNGKLRLNSQTTQTEKNLQSGLKLACEGLMVGIRNSTAHETEKDHEMSKRDALDILGHISYLYRQVDKCQYKS